MKFFFALSQKISDAVVIGLADIVMKSASSLSHRPIDLIGNMNFGDSEVLHRGARSCILKCYRISITEHFFFIISDINCTYK